MIVALLEGRKNDQVVQFRPFLRAKGPSYFSLGHRPRNVTATNDGFEGPTVRSIK